MPVPGSGPRPLRYRGPVTGTRVDEGVGERRRGRPPRTEEERAAHRSRLLLAAMEAIRRRGPDVTLDELAAEAGVSKPVLYDAFGGRAGIADAIARHVADEVAAAVLVGSAGSAPLGRSQLVARYLGTLVDLVDGDREVYGFLVRAIRSPDRGFLDNAWVAALHEQADGLMALLAPDLSPAHLRVLTDGSFGFVFAAIESWLADPALDKAELVRSVALLVDVGLAAMVEQLVHPDPDFSY